MKIFLSWSGERSKVVARALRDWLPLVLHFAQPWLSDKDIDAGERWSVEVGKELESSQFGIICLTPENLVAPWILFEAGALSKQMSVGTVVPYLLGVEFGELNGPLSQFQAKKAERASTFELLRAINSKSASVVPDGRLASLFEMAWPQLDALFKQVPAVNARPQPSRSVPEVLEDLVETVRGVDRRIAQLEVGPKRVVQSPTPPGYMLIEVEIPTPRTLDRNPFALEAKSDDFLARVAAKTGLNSDEFGKGWYLRVDNTTQFLTEEHVQDVVGFMKRYPGTLVLTEIPF